MGGVILTSDDGGATVRVAAEFPRVLGFRQVASEDDGTIWVVGDGNDQLGIVLVSSDAGTTWREVTPTLGPSARFLSVEADGGQIWLAGGVGCDGVLLATTDRGATWREAFRLNRVDLCASLSLVAARGNTIISVGYDGARGAVVVSSDGGTTFQREVLPEDARPVGLAFSDDQTAFIGGFRLENPRIPESKKPVLLRTTDGGEQWESVEIDVDLQIGDITFRSPQQGYAISLANGGGVVLVTDDGGLTWEITVPPASTVSGLRGVGHIFLGGDSVLYGIGTYELFFLKR